MLKKKDGGIILNKEFSEQAIEEREISSCPNYVRETNLARW